MKYMSALITYEKKYVLHESVYGLGMERFKNKF